MEEEFVNESGLKFAYIGFEKIRQYVFSNGRKLKIKNPQYLHICPIGVHRIFASNNWCYYIQTKEGWWIKWKVHKNNPHFVA